MDPILSTLGAPQTRRLSLPCSTQPRFLSQSTSERRLGERYDRTEEGAGVGAAASISATATAGSDASAFSRASSSIERMAARSASGGSRSTTSEKSSCLTAEIEYAYTPTMNATIAPPPCGWYDASACALVGALYGVGIVCRLSVVGRGR
ncbi:uncharacterized protein LOC62_02G003189 [Vanrija pseudolonga]|uniref:Uncharacterized protein n=1 Tax=Vanrija pseudolonga TaxID=143232 RepID=A0AAF1BJB0_9TREE|nr:hypothetical protein LOC62_02G003189 [Vanrija pseudolonga]